MMSDDWTPPTRNGVGASSVALPAGAWATTLDFLTERFAAIPRDEWLARMARGDVLTAQGTVVTPGTPYRPRGKIYYYRNLIAEPRIPFDVAILFQDEHLVVVDKPHFLPVMPAGRYVQETALVRLKRLLNIETLVPVHRIDRDTAGLVLFSVQVASRDKYVALFRQRIVAKSYEAIALRRTDLRLPRHHRSRLEQSESFMQMREVPGAPNSETGIELLETKGSFARYRLSPVTGKKHQLRAHMAALGMPIVNDRIYPILAPANEEVAEFSKPLQLLAKSLAFIDPLSGQSRRFETQQQLIL